VIEQGGREGGRDVCERRGTSHEQHDDDDDVGGREDV